MELVLLIKEIFMSEQIRQRFIQSGKRSKKFSLTKPFASISYLI